MDILSDIQLIVTKNRPVSGRVMTMARGMVRVATPQGLIEAQPGPNLSIGDEVTLENGIAIKKSRGSPPIFQV